MEVIRTKWNPGLLVRMYLCVLLFFLVPFNIFAQQPAARYKVKGNKMYIEVDRQVRASFLDSFITQFDLIHLHLPEFLRGQNAAAIQNQGWQVERNSQKGIIISKPLLPAEDWSNPADRIHFTEIHPTFAERFPATNNGLIAGYNRYRNKAAFPVRNDSVVLFFLRGHKEAREVMLAGSFNNWNPDALSMKATDSGWIAPVKLAPGKYWYKFIVDGHWIVDPDNLEKENDGEGNINSIYFRSNVAFYLPGFTNARRVFLAGSFNQWRPREFEMQRTKDGWVLPLYLSEGTHTYKFVVDGAWIADERNPNKVPDGHNKYNSLISLGKPHLFRLKGMQHAQEVKLAGSFNNWRDFELPMNKTQEGWELSYVLGPGNYEYKYLVDGKWMADPDKPPFKTGSPSTLVIEPNHTFRLKGYEHARQVFLAGDFNNWNPSSFPMKKEGNEWVLPLHLWTGKHRYKFIVDGKWILDPGNKLWEQNEHGTGNSVIWFSK